MEWNEVQELWREQEKVLSDQAQVNREALRKILREKAGNRLDWIRIRQLAFLVLIPAGIIVIAIPRIQFSKGWPVILGTAFFGIFALLTYAWSLRLYILSMKIRLEDAPTRVSSQLLSMEKYKLRNTRYGYILAPFAIIAVFLSAGIPFLSSKMIPFYILCLLVFLLSLYMQSRYGLAARIRKIHGDMEEIRKLEAL